MESNYNNKDFEQFVKENADQYRMFPSDKVWKGVNSALHTRRKWYGFWLGFLLLATGGAVTWVMTIYPSTKKENSITQNNNVTKLVSVSKNPPDINNLLPFATGELTIKNTLVSEEGKSIPLFTMQGNTIEGDINSWPTSQHDQTAQPERFFETGNRISINNNNTTTTLLESNPVSFDKPGFANQPVLIVANNSIDRAQTDIYPLTIESVTNSYQFKKPAKKISWQLFITPTISYRKLSVNNSMDNSSIFNYPFSTLSDVNNAVTHKPDIGVQLGLSGRYPITKNLKLRGGFQFNINRYDIKAYAFNGEVATIDLNGGNGNSSISMWTHYRNYAGYKSNWLKNYYFSVSVPIGLELKLFGNTKTNFGIAGTLQPTYVIKDNAYLISTDYKNYAEVPRLVRHVNLNTSFETFVNYTNGKTKWQIGPQVRYQILSSFHNKYPVKENLFDFGVKVGVTLNE